MQSLTYTSDIHAEKPTGRTSLDYYSDGSVIHCLSIFTLLVRLEACTLRRWVVPEVVDMGWKFM